MKVLLNIVLMLTCIGAVAQQLRVIDAISEEPLARAYVQIEDQQYITNPYGMVTIDMRGTQKVLISHLNYETYHQSLSINPLVTTIKLTKKEVKLNEVIITGQFEPQSIDQTIFPVNVVDAATIAQQGAIDLSDALRNTLNITITPNKSVGTSEVNMLGLDGAYVKTLIDGVPVVSVNGNGNNTDFSQIDISQIERIEIVEGPMAVNYGANASAGVINLITKKNTADRLTIQAYIQEETIGTEYGNSKGNHLQNISAQYNFNQKWGISAKVRRADFKGFWNTYEGYHHTVPDGRRGFDWNPKNQLNWNGSVYYRTEKLSLNYKYDRFRQQLDIPEKIITENEHPQTGLKNPFADQDLRYIDIRSVHNLTVNGKLAKQINYSINNAYSMLNREALVLTSYINTGAERINQTTPSHYRSALSRATLTNFTSSNSPIDYQVGYELNYESIKAPNIRSGNIEGESADVSKHIREFALYFNTEWEPHKYLMIRPGVRTFYNSLYSSPIIYSINTKYKIPGIADIRLSVGRSYRTPNLTELFYYFVDANHDVQGNPNLAPEDGIGVSLDIRRTHQWNSLIIKSTFKVFHNDIKDKITLGVHNPAPLQLRYLNINQFKSKGIALRHQIQYQRLSAHVGISYIGYYNQVNTNIGMMSPDEFLFSPEYNANISYRFKKPAITLAVLYKHTGIKEQYIVEDGKYLKRQIESFDWLDASVTWGISTSVSLQLGIKNLFNNTDLRGSLSSGGAHSDTPTTTGLSYGRSYFAKATYTFTKH